MSFTIHGLGTAHPPDSFTPEEGLNLARHMAGPDVRTSTWLIPVYTNSGIARRYRTTPRAIAEVNNLDDGGLKSDSKLIIPISPGRRLDDGATYARRATRYKVRKGDTLASIAGDFGVSVERLKRYGGASEVVECDVSDPAAVKRMVEAARAIAQLPVDDEDDAETSASAAAPPWHGPEIVFITAYDQYAIEAFEQGVVDYVLKPAERARLQVTVAATGSPAFIPAGDVGPSGAPPNSPPGATSLAPAAPSASPAQPSTPTSQISRSVSFIADTLAQLLRRRYANHLGGDP